MQHQWSVVSILFILIVVLTTTYAQPVSSSRPHQKANIRNSSGANVKTSRLNENSSGQLLSAAWNNPLLLNNIAAEFTRLGQHKTAAEFLERAVTLKPRSPDYLVNLAIVYANLQDPKRSFELLDLASQIDPDHERIEWLFCDVRSQLGEHAKAVTCFDKRIKVQQLDSVSASNFAVSLMALGEMRRAVDVLKDATARYPTDSGAINGLGLALYRSREFSEAAAVYSELVKTVRDQPQYRFNLALALLASKNRKGAIKQYDFLKRSDPTLARRLYKVLFRNRLVNARRPDK